ncbi:MAG: 50S ribosomal protein L3 [Candidatus Omnitrophica bacterium CG_4_9_14_0_2_um_filter_42_8]|nr:MAG: 50S ribosomal protein L3 [Candidatus Omnitrophica bacterium CG22_combo_CG10-13_8_21_14_all_43_16]PJC47287.1 MAG: 50S ribosomal protein L3 [Candidatus Omnitrophica bacterium CG_4_9_14_0_2_um_filter_42_8]
MKIGLLGKKIGMTQIFSDEGAYVPVTVIEAGPCTVLNVSEKKVRLGYGEKKEKHVAKPQIGFYKKINQKPSVFVREIPFDAKEKVAVGQQLTVDIFKEKDFVDIAGTSIGRGFQGVVKRHHFKGGPGGHGSMFHRAPGGIGSTAGGKGCRKNVARGKRFPGHMGDVRKTIQSLQIVKVMKEKNLLLIKGAVPGCRNGYLEIKTAKKR